MIRRLLVSLLAVTLAGLAGLAQALDIRPYDAATLAGLQAAGKPVALHFHADWCPTCVAQSRALDELKADPKLSGLTVLVADYDQEKALKRQLKVRSQSVFVVFKGADEVARSAGQTSPDEIRQALAKSL
ncbi:MAG: thioredoxin family protein [Burkholderiales bacterium]|nr:thioredoxin family protein [Burkholderiales bacterium]